jgi:hypothetical protein
MIRRLIKDCGSRVGQTSGLPVHGDSGSVSHVELNPQARGPANWQTRGPMPLVVFPNCSLNYITIQGSSVTNALRTGMSAIRQTGMSALPRGRGRLARTGMQSGQKAGKMPALPYQAATVVSIQQPNWTGMSALPRERGRLARSGQQFGEKAGKMPALP